MKQEKTNRGFDIAEFTDRYGQKCSLQKSSLATEDCIWLGIDDPDPLVMDKKVGWVKYPIHEDVLIHTRMHLSIDQVKELLPYLKRFVKTGNLI